MRLVQQAGHSWTVLGRIILIPSSRQPDKSHLAHSLAPGVRLAGETEWDDAFRRAENLFRSCNPQFILCG
jgi:hypothetical protein